MSALVFNAHPQATRHDGLCHLFTQAGGQVVLVRPPGAPPHPKQENQVPGLMSVRVHDASDAQAVAQAFDHLGAPPNLVLFDGGITPRRPLLDWTTEAAEATWRRECLGALVVSQEALARMLPAGRGTVLFIGQTEDANLRAPFSVGQAHKAGTRAVAQSMARAFGPKNIHVAHLSLDGEPPDHALAALGEACWQLHLQHRTAWTQELDFRCHDAQGESP
ncbi:MAG: SDR family oxidoreductase [Rubrivivax sp.]|nr:MAG: SDR family oxidoreductase [Rubrivivax sp.]